MESGEWPSREWGGGWYCIACSTRVFLLFIPAHYMMISSCLLNMTLVEVYMITPPPPSSSSPDPRLKGSSSC